jgi:hypothetical protein
MRHVTIAVLVVFMSMPVLAGQASTNGGASQQSGALLAARQKDPYKQLFAAQQTLKQALEQEQAKRIDQAAAAPKIVCGMLMIPADPKIDPKIALPANKQPGVEFKIRTQEPPICNPAK